MNKEELSKILADILPEGIKRLGIKVHFGRSKKNNSHIPTEIFEGILQRYPQAVFFDTNTLYGGERGITERHLEVARKHGFKNAVILKEDKIIKIKDNIYVPEELFEFDYIINAAHFTGHQIVSYGCCIKNVGMGMVARRTKLWVHDAGNIKFYSDRCKKCNWCKENCQYLSTKGIKEGCLKCAKCIGQCKAVGFSFGRRGEVAKRLVIASESVARKIPMLHFGYAENPTKLCDCMGDNNDTIIKKGFQAVIGGYADVVDDTLIERFLKQHVNYKLSKAQVEYFKKLRMAV